MNVDAGMCGFHPNQSFRECFMKFEDHAKYGVASLIVASLVTSIDSAFEPLVIPTALAFSFFPDLDTNSIPQRWAYRALAIVLLVLNHEDMDKHAIALAIVGISPLFHKHRGWTHEIWAPFIFPFFVAVIFGYIVYGYTPDQIEWVSIFRSYWKYIVASIIGWISHLIADGRFH